MQKIKKKNSLELDVRVSRFGSYENGIYNLNRTFNSIPGTSVLVFLTHVFPIKNQQRKGDYLEQLTEYDISKTTLNQYLFETSTNVNLNLNLLQQKVGLYYNTKLLVDLMKKNYENEIEKFKLGNSTQTDIIITLDDYFEALKSLNSLKYNVWKSYINIKYILGELPKNVEELEDFSFPQLFQ